MSTSAVSSTWVFIMPVTTAGTSKTHRPRRARRPFGRLSGYSLVVPGGGYVGALVRAPYGDCGSSVIGPYDGGAAALGGGYWSPSAVASIGAAAVSAGAAACAAGAAASAAAARRSATATSRRLWTERRPSATEAKKRISAPTP